MARRARIAVLVRAAAVAVWALRLAVTDAIGVDQAGFVFGVGVAQGAAVVHDRDSETGLMQPERIIGAVGNAIVALAGTCVYRKPYPGLLSEESAKLAR